MLRVESLVVLEVFHELARHVIENGGTVSFEWPAHCTGWKIPGLKNSLYKTVSNRLPATVAPSGLSTVVGP